MAVFIDHRIKKSRHSVCVQTDICLQRIVDTLLRHKKATGRKNNKQVKQNKTEKKKKKGREEKIE